LSQLYSFLMAELSSTSGSELPSSLTGTRHVVVFVATLVILFGGLLSMTSQLIRDLRGHPFNFAAMQPYEVMMPKRITRRQEAELKIGFAETSRPTEIGLFGNHQIQYFDTRAFDPQAAAKANLQGGQQFFFNHWFADLTMIDLLDYLTYLESIDKLPSKLIIVAITTPNNDNGLHILGRSWHLPPDIRYFTERRVTVRQLADLAAQQSENVFFAAKYYTDYMAMISALEGASRTLQVHDTRICEGSRRTDPRERRGPLADLPVPGMLVNLFAPPVQTEFCWSAVNPFRPDGATEQDFVKSAELVLNENPLDSRRTALHVGDDEQIANVMRAIEGIGRRTGRKVLFLIPPVYETKRPSPADDLFSAALARVPELNVLDQRHQYNERKNFIVYDHPNRNYFRIVADIIMKKYF
jgi:hypothetical protein